MITVAPHLNTVMDNNDLVYCATFQMAWNELMDKYSTGPLKLDREVDYVDFLNKRDFEKAALSPDCFIALCDTVDSGVIQKIQKELADRFRETSKIDFSGLEPSAIIAYAFLLRDIKFIQKYCLLDPMDFKGTKVSTFGLKKGREDGRHQTKILFYDDPNNFAISIKSKIPDILVLAKIPPEKTLFETIAKVEQNIRMEPVKDGDILQVPDMAFDLGHHFKEICGAYFLNKELSEYFIEDAVQFIKFSLNAEGAVLRSEAAIMSRKCISRPEDPKVMVFNDSFLVYMKSHINTPPYFAAWVNTPEFLKKV
jgi:hypothetical protein